jgi:hypothetical protein
MELAGTVTLGKILKEIVLSVTMTSKNHLIIYYNRYVLFSTFLTKNIFQTLTTIHDSLVF